MEMHKRVVLSILVTFAICITLLIGSVFKSMDNKKTEIKKEQSVKLLSSEKVDIVTASGSDYSIVFSSDVRQGDQALANELSSLIRSGCGVTIRCKVDTITEETKFEILLGNTNRTLSGELLEAINAYSSSSDLLIWGYTYKDGKLAYTANSNEAFLYGSKDFLSLLSSDGTMSVPTDLWVVNGISKEEYEEYKRQEYLDSLLEMYNAFTNDQFNTDQYTPGQFYKPMIDASGNGYFKESISGSPWAYPTDGNHPRYLITSSKLDRIREILIEGENADSIYCTLVKQFWLRVNTNMESIHYGVFQDQYKGSGSVGWIDPTNEPYRYDATVLSVIEAKALAYLITGDEIYAYEAIIGIKNAMLSLHYTTDLHQDTYHGASHVMATLAAVYDWCYDVLSETDKWQLIWGTAQILGPQMEAGFQYPPSGMSAFSGHGTDPGLLRSWISVASVFYDEAPDWWEFVAGRYFNEFLQYANAQFEVGWVAQGVGNYASLKLHCQLWAAYLVYLATGENFLTDGADMTAYYMMSHITPRQTENSYEQFYFSTGDGGRGNGGVAVSYSAYFVFAALYNDPVIYAQALALTNNHFLSTEKDSECAALTMTHAYQLCIAAMVNYNGEGMRDGVDTIQYFADPAGQMTIRESWEDPDSIAVFMLLHNLTMGNHEGTDHGTFQIYYKGLLAATNGRYYKYGAAHHSYYMQSTVSTNGLLVFNPSLASTDVNRPGSYFYSGSQRIPTLISNTISSWYETGLMAETIGASYGYNLDGTAKYAYLAGDLTNAYDSKTVDYVSRGMFTFFTGDEDFPALFFTFDQIVSDDENFTKHWLLHTIKEPEIDQDNLTATVINGDGKMYVKSLYGADAIVKIGGEGKAYWVNGYFVDPNDKGSWNEKTQDFEDPENIGSWVEGKNVYDEMVTSDNFDTNWGRIELRASGEKRTKLLTVMAITDTLNEAAFEITEFKTDDEFVYGAQFKNDVFAFVNNEEKVGVLQYKEFSFETEGKGLYNYYVMGLEAGTWNILVDGVSVGYVLSDDEGAMVSFIAPTGNIILKPGADVIGENGGKIKYNTGGAILPDDTRYVYNSDEDYLLPVEVTRGDDIFLGWYTTPTYDKGTEITMISAGTTGTVSVYAKWISNFCNENYASIELNVTGQLSANGITYNAQGSASFITKYDAERECNYLQWLVGDADPIITQSSTSKNLSMLGTDDKCVSFTVSLMLEPGKECIASGMRTKVERDVNGGSINQTGTKFFSTNADGYVETYDGGLLCKLSDKGITDIRFVLDFKNKELRYYDQHYNLIATDKWTPPSSVGTSDGEEYMKCLTKTLWYWRATSSGSTDATLRVYGIRVQEGDEFTGLAKPQTEGIKYNTGGALLPYDAPIEFNSDGSETMLPILERGTDIFLGWYTTPTFDYGTETTCAPAGATGLYEVYAKWKCIFVDEDYSDIDINVTEKMQEYNNITYNGASKPGASFKIETKNGKRYLVWTVGEADSIITAQSSFSNISTMTENAVSYTLKLSKNGDAAIPDFGFRIRGNKTVSGAASNGNVELSFARIIDEVFYIGNGTVPVATITNEILTIRLVIDFERGMIIAYDEEGNVIVYTQFDIPAASGATTTLELKKCFNVFALYSRGQSSSVTDSIRYYGIRIEEGNVFGAPPKIILPKTIVYNTNGGILPDDTPMEYTTDGDATQLPIDAKRDKYIFLGWYTTPTFEEGTETTFVPTDTEGTYEVWAKWKIDDSYYNVESDHLYF